MSRYPKGRKAVPRGLWLAVLAIGGQVLLPFLLAFEIALTAAQGDGEISLPLCSDIQHAAVPKPGNERTGHHTLPGGCRICQALATAQLFTQPPVIALGVPTNWTAVTRSTVANRCPTFIAAASYRSRAPPSSV